MFIGNVCDCKRYVYMFDLGHIVERILGLPDLILFLANNVSVVHVSRYGLTRGTLLGKRVLTLILTLMTGGLLKMVSNWIVSYKMSHNFQCLLHCLGWINRVGNSLQPNPCNVTKQFMPPRLRITPPKTLGWL
jgi:hypothetical protein